MRNPQRIARILALIEIIWNKYPDWRLGQLLSDVTNAKAEENLFYIEDDEVEEFLKKELERIERLEVHSDLA